MVMPGSAVSQETNVLKHSAHMRLRQTLPSDGLLSSTELLPSFLQ
jgi:hypothetical protein